MVVGRAKFRVPLGQIKMRVSVAGMVLAGLAACTPQMPESGVGFQDYNSYLRNREMQAAPSVGVAPVAPVTGFSADAAAAAIDRADGVDTAPLPMNPVQTGPSVTLESGERARGNAPAGIRVESGEVAGTVSDEQDFDAVSSRETIESDKARIDRNRAQYIVIQPGALPVRPGETGPNIVAYALATNNVPGVALYSRSRLRVGNPQAACAKYGSPDIAQEAFLQAGGPDRDRRGLDPDGDGFACSWDPRPFRTALQ